MGEGEMGTEIKQVLSEDEQLAIEILEKTGWKFFAEVSVEKATPEGKLWPEYTSGGEYAVGVLRFDAPKLSDRKVKTPGKKK